MLNALLLYLYFLLKFIGFFSLTKAENTKMFVNVTEYVDFQTHLSLFVFIVSGDFILA